MSDKYRMIGPLYDILATIFSFGQIDRCKCGMHDRIRPDMEVLFAGVGQGIDAIEAASLGAQVTVVDLSETMLTVFRTRVQGRYFIPMAPLLLLMFFPAGPAGFLNRMFSKTDP